MAKTRCNRHVESDNGLGLPIWYPCRHGAIAKVTYRSAASGKPVEENLCKMHLRHTRNNSAKIKSKYGFDTEFKEEPLTK